jgi:hypothetical protein
MPKCTVKSAIVDEEMNSTTGNVIRSQFVDLDLGNGHALPFKVGLGKKPAYQAGEYDIDPKCFGLDGYGNLVLKKYVDLVATGARKA